MVEHYINAKLSLNNIYRYHSDTGVFPEPIITGYIHNSRSYANVLSLLAATLESKHKEKNPPHFPSRISLLLNKCKIKHIVEVGSNDAYFLFQLRSMLRSNKIKITGVDLHGISSRTEQFLLKHNIEHITGDGRDLPYLLKGKADIIFARGVTTLGDLDWEPLFINKNKRGELARELYANHYIAEQMTKSLSDNPNSFAMKLTRSSMDPFSISQIYIDPNRISGFTDILYWNQGNHPYFDYISDKPMWLQDILLNGPRAAVWTKKKETK